LLIGQRNHHKPSPYFEAKEYAQSRPLTDAKKYYPFLHYLLHTNGFNPATPWDKRYLEYAPEAKDYERSLLLHAILYHQNDFGSSLEEKVFLHKTSQSKTDTVDYIFSYSRTPSIYVEKQTFESVNIEINYCNEDLILIGSQAPSGWRKTRLVRLMHENQTCSSSPCTVEVVSSNSVRIKVHKPTILDVELVSQIWSYPLSEEEKILLVVKHIKDLESRGAYSSSLRARTPDSFRWSVTDVDMPFERESTAISVTFVPKEIPKNNVKRILLFSHEDSRTGAPIYLGQLAEELLGLGFDVHVVSLRPEMRAGTFSFLKRRHTYLEDCKPKQFRTALIMHHWLLTGIGEMALRAHILKIKPDLVLANSLCSSDGIKLVTKMQIPNMLYVHESWNFDENEWKTNDVFQLRVREALEASNVTIFGSKSTQNHWLSSGFAINGYVIPTLRKLKTPDTFKRKTLNHVLRKSMGIPNHSFVLLSVATFEDRKRIEDIVRSFLMFSNPDSFLILVGRDPKGSNSVLEDLVRGNKNIRIVDATHDLAPYYAAANCLVFASQEETMPLILQEAAQWKIPRISSMYPGYEELIPNDKYGFLFPVGDISRLAQLMNHVYENRHNLDEIQECAYELQNNLHYASSDHLIELMKLLMHIRTSVYPSGWITDES